MGKLGGSEITLSEVEALVEDHGDGTYGLDGKRGLKDLQFTSGYYLDDLTDAELKRLKICLGDSDGYSSNNIEVYDWDYGATMFFTEDYDTWIMSGTPHVIKLVKRLPNDDFDG